MDEFVLWRGKANLKIGIAKIVGELTITNKKLSFKSLGKEIKIKMGEIRRVEIVKKIIKRVKIETPNQQYLFFIPHPENVFALIKNFAGDKEGL